MASMDAVGSSATASKKPSGKQVLTEVNIKPSENGGFTVDQRYRQESGRRNEPSPYVEPKTFTFESFDTMVSHLASEFGGAAPAASAPPAAEPPPPPAAAETPPMPLEQSGLYSGVARG